MAIRRLLGTVLATVTIISAQTFMEKIETALTTVDRVATAGPFQPSWDSLKRYEVPEWYKDAKFGIFIHWGVYSVPAFGSEWYPRKCIWKGPGIQAPRRHLRAAEQVRLQGFHPDVQGREV